MKPKSPLSLPASAFVTDSRPPQPTVTLIVLSGLPEVMAHDYPPWDTERLMIDTARLTVPQSVQAILSASGLTLTSRQAAD